MGRWEKGGNVASTIVGFLLICVYFISDTRFRTDEKARRLTVEASDRKSTRYLLYAYGISILFLLVSPVLNAFQIGHVTQLGISGWAGVLLMVAGIALRGWSTRVLGRFYTRTLVTASDHRIVEEGPYHLVRHPGYSGSLLVWIGAGLASNNWIAFAVISLACVGVYLYRIRSEEAMLVEKFGSDYVEYRMRTKRLIPFLY